jgi:hypothetical protein
MRKSEEKSLSWSSHSRGMATGGGAIAGIVETVLYIEQYA